MSHEHILIVEDDIELACWIKDYLVSKEYKVTLCHQGNEAVGLIRQLRPDLIILDGMLPGLDGLEVCKQVRAWFHNPIVMLTARDEEIDEVLGLEMGADEYLTKPVRARALLTRIRKLLKRPLTSELSVDSLRLTFGSLVIDRSAMSVQFDQRPISVSSSEFELIWILASNAGEIVTREALVNQLRGFEYDGFDRSIDLKISRLRKKLDDRLNEQERIKTIWGKGYLFVADPS